MLVISEVTASPDFCSHVSGLVTRGCMLGSVSADVAVAAPDGTGAWAPDVAAPGSAGRPAGASAAHAGKAGLRRLKEDMLVMVLACVSVTSWFVTNNYRTNRY